jgi:glutaredoxin
VGVSNAVKARQIAGYQGEQKLDYYLESLSNEFMIMNDLGLKVRGSDLQIDSLAVTDKAIFLLDSKNYKGLITFDTELKQCIRENDETLDGFNDPLTQLENTEFLLTEWLQQRHLLGLPIISYIAFAYSHSIIKVIGDQTAKQKITYATAVRSLLTERNNKMERKNHDLKGKIIHAMMKECFDFRVDVMDKYRIGQDEILPGVLCYNCQRLNMLNVYGIWHCPHCKFKSDTAHEQALKDYFLLIHDEISNEQCRKFLKVDSRHAVKRLLKKTPFITQTPVRNWVRK